MGRTVPNIMIGFCVVAYFEFGDWKIREKHVLNNNHM